MQKIPQSFIDDLLSRLDIVSVIDSRVKLKKAGKNYSACCPFHQEKTPSFTVSPDKQFYYCFGCGATGNAIGFVMDYEREGFVDAVESLAKTAGLEVPREQSPQLREQDFRRKKLHNMLEAANVFYQEQLRQNPQKHRAVKYLKERGLTGQIAKNFGLGFAAPGSTNLINRLGKNEEDTKLLIDSGLAISKEEENKLYDRFRHRIMFPIRDERGRVIGFGGRVLGNEKPKYLNSPETEVFHKSRELYGLYEARQHRGTLESLLVVEGYMDVIALAQYGVNNAVATLGTACGEEHLKLAFRYVSDVVFCFDGDNAGRTAAKRALMNSLGSMEDGRQIKFLFLPEGQDPDSLVRQIGPDRFKAQVKQAVPLEEFLFDAAAEGIDINSMEGRARFSKIAAPFIDQIPEGIYKELMLENLARRTGLTREVLNEIQKEKLESLVEDTVKKPVDSSEPAEIIPEDNTASIQPEVRRASSITLTPARIATILLLENPHLAEKIENLPELEAGDPDNSRLTEIVSYLKKRPNSNFSNILGFWGGTKGLEKQHELANLMANQLLSSAKTVASYNPMEELEGAINCLALDAQKKSAIDELQRLKSKGLKSLTDEEKSRLIELSRQ